MTLANNTVISASAGSGKTFRLTLRYIKLLNSGVSPEKIIALTFTKKAAGEIFNKIIDRLLIWHENEDLLVKDCKVDNIEGMTKERVFELLKKIIEVQHRISISTLDSFLFKVLQSFPYEYGIDSKLEVIDGESNYAILDNTLRELLLKELSDETKDSLFEAFKQATFGKEEVSVYKTIEDFIKSHYAIFKKHPESSAWGNESVLHDNFKRDYHVDIDAANKMFEDKEITTKVFAQFKDAILNANDFTEESIINDSVKEFFKRIIENGGGLASVLNASMRNESISLKFGNKNLDFDAMVLYQTAMRYLSSIFKAKLHETKGIYKALNLYNENYLNSVQENGLIAFDDILLFLQGMALTSESLQAPNQLYIDYRLDNRYDHWLIDEFQDTSRPQWNVIANLIDEIMNDLTGKRTFFYVGDVKQAIYSWRGGDSYLFNNIKDKYNDRLIKEKLFKSYRSSKAVIETVNLVFDNLHKIEELNPNVIRLWENNWNAHETVKIEEGYSVVYEFDGKKYSDEEEKTLPLKDIGDILNHVKPLERGLSVGILVLRNNDADEIEEYLTNKRIPCAKEGSFYLVSSPAVRLLLSLFKIIHHPGDTIALGMIELSSLSGYLPNESGKLMLEKSIEMLVKDLHLLGFVGFTLKWANIIKGKVLENNSELHELRLDQTVYAAEFYQNNRPDVVSFIKHIENYKIPVKADTKCVQIITVYKAKGLEYDMVIFPKLSTKGGILNAQIHKGIQVLENENCDQEIAVLLPPRDIASADNFAKEKIKNLDIKYCYEQLCVLYVALTRAKKAMYVFSEPDSEKSKTIHLSTVLNRLLGGNPIANQPTAGSLPIVYEHGNAEWFVDKKKLENKSEITLIPKNIKLISSTKKQTVPPSKRTKFHALDLMSDQKNKALTVGLCIHEIFEHIEWIDDSSDSDSIIDNIIFSKPFEKKTVRESKLKVKEVLKNIEIRKLLSKPSDTAELWCEKEFSLFINGIWEKGRFDRVVIEKDDSGNILKSTIIDYKYEEINDNEIIKEKYSKQLQSYRDSLSYILKIPLKNIEARLLLINRIAIINFAELPIA